MSVTSKENHFEVYLLTAVFASILLLLIVVITQNAFADVVVDKIRVGTTQDGIGVNPTTNTIYVVNNGNAVSVIDGTTDNILSTIQVEDHAKNVAVNPNTHRIYVTHSDVYASYSTKGNVTVIDGATNSVIGKVEVGPYPFDVAVNPATNQIYVTEALSGKVVVIDGSTDNIVASIPVGEVYGIDVNPNTNTIYAVCDCPNGQVAVIDGATNTVSTMITISSNLSAFDVAVNPDTNMIYVTWRYNVAVIDGRTNTVVAGVGPVTPSLSIDANPYTNKIYIDHNTCRCLSIVNGSDNSIMSQLPISVEWAGIGINANTDRIYAVDKTDNTIAVIDGSSSNTVPSPPQNLQTTAISSSQIDLSWATPSNGGSPITGYQIERSQDNGARWSVIVPNTNSTSTTYSDTGLSSGTTYTYKVSAINSVGTSQPSNIASATTNSPPPSGITLNNVQSISDTSSDTITLSNFNIGTGVNNLLVVGVSANNNDVSSITFNGTPLTPKAYSFYNNDAEFWFLKNPSGTGDITVTMNGPTDVVVGAYSFSGVNQTSTIPTKVVKHNIVPNSPKVTITAKYANSVILDLPSIWGGITLGSPTCTSQWNLTVPDGITGASSSKSVTTPGATSCNWTASSPDFWDDVAIEIKAAE